MKQTYDRVVLQNTDAVFMHRQPDVFALLWRGRDGLKEGRTNQYRVMLRAGTMQSRLLTSASNSLAPKKGHFLATVR